MYVRSFGDRKKIYSQHSQNSQSSLCSDCHLLGPKSNSAVRSKLNLPRTKFCFYEIDSKLECIQRKVGIPRQSRGDREARP